MSDGKIPLAQFLHPQMLIETYSLVVSIYIQFHQTRARMHLLNILDGMIEKELPCPSALL